MGRTKSDHFVENLDKESISKIDSKLSLMLQNETMEQNDIDEVVQKIGEIFERSAETSFGYVKNHSKESKLKSKNQPWFTNNCMKPTLSCLIVNDLRKTGFWRRHYCWSYVLLFSHQIMLELFLYL